MRVILVAAGEAMPGRAVVAKAGRFCPLGLAGLSIRGRTFLDMPKSKQTQVLTCPSLNRPEA